MKRSRSDISTGASLFRELKLKRQRLSMLLNRDINDVLSSTSSSDTGDHGSDVDAGPPLMLREDSACFESRRHDAVDSGASSDGDWSFCGNGYSTRHPLMLIPDHTRLLSSHVGQSGLFSGHPSSGDRKTFAVGKPGPDAEPVSMTTRGVDFGQTNMSATLPPSCGSEFLSPQVTVSRDRCGSRPQTEVNSSALSRFKSGASIWLHHDTFRRRQNDDRKKRSQKLDDITSGLTFDPHTVKDIPEVEPAGSVGGYVQENGHVQESDHVREIQASDYGQVSDRIQVNDYSQAIDPSTQDSNSGQMVSTLSVPSALQSGTPSLTSDDQSCALTDPVLCERPTHLETRSVIQHGSDIVVSVKLEEKLCEGQRPLTSGGLARGDKPVLDWTQLDQLKHTQETSYNPAKSDKADPDKQQLVCEICTDRASGLHYGIISCEGCKGFFKRTVQNKRVYSCIANGDCQVTKLRRNRCQYCRFKKCLLKGMVLAAVRDDRMPGGRNSGAVYSLYKVKYRKPGRTADASSRRTTARRLKSVGGVGSSSKHSRSLDQADRTGQKLWLQQDVTQATPDTHSDTCVCQRQPSAGFCGRLVHGADGITVSQDSADMSAGSLGVSHDRNMAADMSADMSRESVTLSDDTSVSGSRQFSASHDRNLLQDSPSHDTYMNADNSNLSQYSNINVDNPSVCYNRNIHADGATVSQYENADSPTVSRYLSADSPTVSRYLNADSSSVITCGVRYADGADMNRSRRSVIADSREMADRQTEVIYDRVSVNAVGETSDSRHSNNTGSRHSNHTNMEDADRGRSGSHLVHIEQLLRCEQTHDLATATQPYSGVALSTLLRHLSDNVVRELVKWMKTLPFYDRLPMSVHRQCLAEKWYDLLLLTMLAHQACTGQPHDGSSDDVNSHVACNVMRLQHGLRHVLDHEMPVDELYREVGDIVQKLTDIVLNFRRLGLTREEYVCLKVILLLTHDSAAEANETTEHIHGIYRDVLRQLVSDTFPHEPTRFTELLLQLPHIQTVSSLLMKTNTIYIPSMLNAPLQ